MKASMTRNIWWCLGNRRLALGPVVTLARGAFSWLSRVQAVASSGISEAGYIALSEAVEKVLVLRQEVQNFVELSMKMPHHRREGSSTLT